MLVVNILVSVIDWFIPEAAKAERSERSLARNFVFTHIFGPLLSQGISLFLYLSDPNPGYACWTIIIAIWLFWTLPFVYKFTGDLQLAAVISTEMLALTSLFGAYFYGGVSSPFLPWLIVSLLLGFFYLSERPLLIVGLFSCNVFGFCAAYVRWGFPELVPPEQLATVGWISILSATTYMSWMAIYYAHMISTRSDLEREAERHRETTARMREAKRMADEANRAKSIFLAKMSHELRTPLNAVIGFSEILLEGVEPGERNARKKTDLERINAAGKHLLSLVADVLDLSKIESNMIELKIESFDLAKMVQDVVGNVEPMLAGKHNRLVVDCPADLGIVSTDQTKLRQAALNLLSNAAKFTEAGTITLSVRRQKSLGADWVEIAVRDTGIGISESELPRLFKNFGQANRETASKYGGTGLGLAISQKLCALMGGGISAVSEPGRGSCFTIRVLAGADATSDESAAILALSPANRLALGRAM
ncbi:MULTISPECIES: ATP-binding protein [Rhodopseudomonas]|uniref:sensor histidine kinase n=1 Tax=Rhodopseudomonas TaxID=1073 RepID=UPI000698E071|nr:MULTISPECIES: ATP-binding protein [Rhodopseudomonas]MDF3812982.1 ATP-binding protein [Rhodopseudomonas sp. BAL398]WOK17500.1 ATP-binding protein [Rhodopseudomonas sp. BAL398]